MGKTDYVLEPILRVLKDGEETPSSEIRQRVADALGLSEADRKYIAPGSPYAEFKYAVAHGLVRLQSLGHLKKVPPEKIYRLTASGAELAALPRSLSLSDIKRKQSPNEPVSSRSHETAEAEQEPGTYRMKQRDTVKPKDQALPGGNRASRVLVWLAGVVLVGVILAAAWPYIKLLGAVAVLALAGGWRHLRIRRAE